VTQRRFLNFSPLPVSHHPPLPSQPEQGFGFGGSFGSSGSGVVMRLACASPRSGVNAFGLLWPRSSLSKKFWKLDLEYAELIRPRIAHYPEIKPSLLLVVPPRSAKRFEALNFGFNVVGFQVEMHSLFGTLGIVGLLKKNAYLGVR
jgi:hypothetical protein